jgi:hypothetical protein
VGNRNAKMVGRCIVRQFTAFPGYTSKVLQRGINSLAFADFCRFGKWLPRLGSNQ